MRLRCRAGAGPFCAHGNCASEALRLERPHPRRHNARGANVGTNQKAWNNRGFGPQRIRTSGLGRQPSTIQAAKRAHRVEGMATHFRCLSLNSVLESLMAPRRPVKLGKDVEPLEFEALFGLFHFIDWRSRVNRPQYAAESINSCFRMVSSFNCEHLGSDRCRKERPE